MQIITTQTLVNDLKNLGVQTGQTLLVHTSMKALGKHVLGDAPAVVDALMEVITPEGTLVMPTNSTNNTDPATWGRNPFTPEQWDTIRAEMPPYRPEITPSNRMGMINECFRTYPGVRRSSHPAFSFAAWGKHAAFVTANQSLNNSVAEQSPVGRVYELDGWILLMGVGYERNTSLHLADYWADYPFKEREDNGSAMLVNGRCQWVTYYDEAVGMDNFAAIGESFERETDEVMIGKVAAATVRLMRQRALVDYAVRWLETNRAEA
ncbi:MAG: AAC(3) family N-acetyltransferase [Anaerolineales bacterium]|nr:AAC(3) family N-acetyltransferase [Anaerolineales bacterium]